MQEFQSNGICSPTSCVSEVDETKGIYTCSEEEVLNITFEACDTMGTGEVLASTVMQYLQDMTAQSPERGRLVMLYNMLDPDRQGVAVNRDTFHAAMKRWIVECSQDCMLEEDCQNAETENRTHINGNELSAAETEKAFHEGTDGLDHETSDLINRVADLQYANQKLGEQNSSLLRAVEMCEEANLQLTDEIVTLKGKLTRIRQLELQKVLKDEAEERVSEQNDRAAEAEKGAKEAKKTAAVSWWRAVKVEEEKVKAKEEAARLKTRLLDTEERLLQAQRTIEEMESKVTVEEEKVKDREKAARLKKRLLETEERLLQAQRTIEEMGSKSNRLEQMLLESQQRTLTAETRARVAEDKMAATLNITENKVKAVDQRLAELQEERIKDSTGHVIDLVKDQLPDVKLSDKDTKKNLELLEEAKKVSEQFFMRRGRRSTCSLSDSPTGVSPNLTPRSSPVPSRSSSLTQPPQIASDGTAVNSAGTSPTPQSPRKGLVDRQVNEQQKISQGLLSPRHGSYGNSKEALSEQKENCDPRIDPPNTESKKLCFGLVTNIGEKSPAMVQSPPGNAQPQKSAASIMNPGLKAPTKAHKDPTGACTAELKSFGSGPALMRALSWDGVEQASLRNGAQDLPTMTDESFTLYDKSSSQLLKSTGYKDFPVQPVKTQKLVKLREENKLLRNQTMAGLKLPDLSETAEQERGPSPLPSLPLPIEEEPKEKSDVMPNISDVMLRKLKVLRSLPGSAPPLTEKEVENAFVQLSLAFRNDSYTLETRLRQAERERTQTEDNTDKELEDFKGVIKGSILQWQNCEQRESYERLLETIAVFHRLASRLSSRAEMVGAVRQGSILQWQNCEQRESYERLLETIAVFHRLASRLSSRAEMVGAVRQEKRMSKATEVMMQYVENLKRTYEKDHAELIEYKKLANQNSSRYGAVDSGEDGVPRASRSMSLTLGKALPRRRVSVAVVPKFSLLNIPNQSPGAVTNTSLPPLCEVNSGRTSAPTSPVQPPITENGKASRDQENAAPVPAPPPSSRDEIRSEIKAKIEEDAYNKGYQEGLKRSKELQEVKEEEEKIDERQKEAEEKTKELEMETQMEKEIENKKSSRFEEAVNYIDRLCPKVFRQHRLVWIIAAVVVILAFVVSIFTSYNNSSTEVADTSPGKSACSGKKQYFGWNVGLQHKNPTPE
ncbi:UNVERIFIED_CONTAM: hypothetical protein FKN15_041724 [Acipenser sinensis]